MLMLSTSFLLELDSDIHVNFRTPIRALSSFNKSKSKRSTWEEGVPKGHE